MLFLAWQSGDLRGEASLVQLRTIFAEPSSADQSYFVGNPGESLVPLKLSAEGLGEPQTVKTGEDGVIRIFKSATVDISKAADDLIASAKLPANTKSAIAVLVPNGKGALPYGIVLIKDDAGAFPWGESKVLNMMPKDFAVEVGGDKIFLPGGKITRIPKITKLDIYNRTQTNFYYKDGEQWVVASERQMQFIPNIRRLFLIYKSRGAVAPDVRSIIDQPPPVIE